MVKQVVMPTGTMKSPEVSGLRKGRWVIYQDQIGIIVEMTGRSARVMLTDERGLNKLEIFVSLDELRRARAREIPKERVSHLDEADLKAIGYL